MLVDLAYRRDVPYPELPDLAVDLCLFPKKIKSPGVDSRSISSTQMFGASVRSVLASMEMLSDEVSLLEMNAPREPPYQSLLEAIQRSDTGMTVVQPDKPQGRP